MKSKYSIYAIIVIQLVIDLAMWYFATTNAYQYQAYWAILLAFNIMLVSLVMLIILRYYMKRSEIYG